jgi:hypothetical protein
MSVTAVITIGGMLIDAAMGLPTLIDAFAKFREGRDPGETKEQAAAEYVREMLSLAIKEREAQDAIAAWLAKHGK